MVPSAVGSWPTWLWAEHGILLGLIGWSAWRVWRDCSWQAALRGATTRPRGEPEQSAEAASSGAVVGVYDNRASGAAPNSALDLECIPRDVVASLERLKLLAGPREVLTWPDVTTAPGASMNVAALEEGQASSFRDGRGAIYKFKLADGVYVNMYHTKAGYRRSGDLHDCNQYDVVLRGRTRLRIIDPHSGREVVQEYGANDFIVIPARTPHMFEFLEDNYLLEWWDADFKAWYYKPYRSVIEQGLPLSESEGRDFSRRSQEPSQQ